MKRRLVISGAIAAIVLGTVVVPAAHALLSSVVEPCQEAIAKSGLKFASKKLKTRQKCNEKNMKTPGACAPADLSAKIAALTTKLNDGLAKKCTPGVAPFPLTGLSNPNASGIHFPGKCPQGGPNNFGLADLQACMDLSHEDAVDALINIEWGTTTTNPDPLVQKCQKEIDKDGTKVLSAVLKAVAKCRNAINKGGPGNPITCATADPTASGIITKAQSKATAGITAKCLDSQITALDVCNPNATTAVDAAACIVSTHTLAADDPSVTSADLIDFEYAATAVCGDNFKNQITEECDGPDDAACPGQCGTPSGNFPCLCLTVPRERIIEHANSDLDNGWSGQSHDAGVVEGGGYVVNLYDCDSNNTCGDDTCTIGASCSGAPHSFCTNDSQCSFFGQGTCRTDETDVGPHCILNLQQTCTTNADCPTIGDNCVKTFHGAPLPLSAGGISVCVLNIFSENVVGTKNVGTGSGSVRLRQRSITHLTGQADMPCPVCGGWCEAPPGANGTAGNRHHCATNADCADVGPAHHCTTDPVCNFGKNQDAKCRPDPPFGGPTALFGNPSVDCLPSLADNITGIGLDILFNPATTGTVNTLPTVQCDDTSFTFQTCAGGSNVGATCTTNSECPGGSCTFQCYCPTGGAIHERPNACDAACLGGGNDASPCVDNSECPGGFCHLADCRTDPTAPGVLQPNEGACTTTVEGHCSVSAFRSCSSDPQCQPPACPNCQPTETCNITGKNCFINAEASAGLTRVGFPDPTNPRSASVFCIAATGKSSVDSTAGLPGPGALIQPETTVDTGLTICP